MLRQRLLAPSHDPLIDPPGVLDDAAPKSNVPPRRTPTAPDPVPSSKTVPSTSHASIGSGTAHSRLTMNFKSPWMVFAVASGTCAAFNGVFAKLTTTELTTSIAGATATFLHLGEGNKVVEFTIRALYDQTLLKEISSSVDPSSANQPLKIFFLLNLGFNALMWVLFTRALTLNSSTTRVSILNTSSNFLITAVLGLLVFSEKLPPLWFAGAAMLVIGNVVIGRREEEGDGKSKDLGQPEEIEEGMGLLIRANGEEIEEAQPMKAGVSVSTSWVDHLDDDGPKELK
ncbi:hypothetical protein MMC13_003407 [Lambiella insularis]|nr:hypothetical protein [Lambiella insularis]